MGLFSRIASIFHEKESSVKSVDERKTDEPAFLSTSVGMNENTGRMGYADSSSIALDERKFYQPDDYYTLYSYPETDMGHRVITFEERKKTCIPSERGLYVAEILLLDYCQKGKYPKPDSGYPGFWWFEYGIRDVGHALESLRERGFIEPMPLMQSVGSLNVADLKKLLRRYGGPVSGKKAELVKRVQENVPEEAVAETGLIQKYRLTDLGRKELEENAYVSYMHRASGLTMEDVPEDQQFNVWIVNKKLHEEGRTDWKNLIDEIQQKRRRSIEETNRASIENLKKFDPKGYEKLRAQDEQIDFIQKMEAKYHEDEDALVVFWEEIWENGGLKFEGAHWLFRLPDLYLKRGQLDQALKLCKQIKIQKRNYADKAEFYISRIETMKKKDMEKGTKK